MKKVIALVCIIIFTFALTSCGEPIVHNSLEEYIARVERYEYKLGYSNIEIDQPKEFLPSDSFFSDYAHSDGGFYYYENSLFGDENSKSILWLEYTPEVYTEAKASLNDIIAQSKRSYSYGDYSFFLHHDFFEDDGGTYPAWFTLAGYNDTTYTLFFLGFYLYPSRFHMSSEELNELMEPDFGKFLNTFYSEQYNFEENCPVD